VGIMDNTISKSRLKDWIEDGIIAILDHNGEKSSEEYLWDQLDEGWRIGAVTVPVSNAIVKTWIVCTASHRDHRGFDASSCVEIVSEFEEEPDFYEEFSEAGGMVWEVENN
jgi:hypothetical protein